MNLIRILTAACLIVIGMSHEAMAASPATEKGVQSKTQAHHVLFELTSGEHETWNSILNNVENLRKSLGAENTAIEIVVHGKALNFLKLTNTDLSGRMRKLANSGVVFAACENAMKRQKITKADLLSFVQTVDSGVAEVVRKQEAGWSYVRTGG